MVNFHKMGDTCLTVPDPTFSVEYLCKVVFTQSCYRPFCCLLFSPVVYIVRFSASLTVVILLLVLCCFEFAHCSRAGYFCNWADVAVPAFPRPAFSSVTPSTFHSNSISSATIFHFFVVLWSFGPVSAFSS